MTRKSLMGFFSRESRLALTLFCSSADMRCGGRPGLQPPAGDRGLSRRQTPQEVPGYRITSFLASWSPRCVVKSARRSACLRLPGHYPLEECACACACMLSRSVVSSSLRSHGLWPSRLLYRWDFPGKNTRVGCHFLLYPASQLCAPHPCPHLGRRKAEVRSPGLQGPAKGTKCGSATCAVCPWGVL